MLTCKLSINLTSLLLRFTFVIATKILKPLRILDVLGNNIKNLDLIISGHFIAGSRFLNFKCDKSIFILHILCKPNCAELSPT